MPTILIDDIRSFRDNRPCLVARSSAASIQLLQHHRSSHIDELWLDHDLLGDDTIWPVVEELSSHPYDIGKIWIQAARSGPAIRVKSRLAAAGYRVERSYDLRLWRHDWDDAARAGQALTGAAVKA